MLRKLLSVAVLISALGIAAPGTASHSNCFDGRDTTFAKLIQPKDGNVQVQSGPTGPIVVPAVPGAPSVTLSTTGEIEVKIDQACVKQLRLTVTKDGALVHTKTWETTCDHSTITDQVPIGLNAGTYEFQLDGVTCSGAPTKYDGHGGFVADPPLI